MFALPNLFRLYHSGLCVFTVGLLMGIGCNARQSESSRSAERALSSTTQNSRIDSSASIELQTELVGQAVDSNNLIELDRLLQGTISKNEKAMESVVLRSLDRRNMPSFRILMAKMPLSVSEIPNSLSMKKAVREGNLEAALVLYDAKRRCEPAQLIQLLEDDRVLRDSKGTNELIRLLGLVQNELDEARRLRFLKKLLSSHQFRGAIREWLDWISTQPTELQRAAANEVINQFTSGQIPPPNDTLPLSAFRFADDSAKVGLLSSLCSSNERRQRISGSARDLGLEKLDLYALESNVRIKDWPELYDIASKSRTVSLSDWARDVETFLKRQNSSLTEFSKIWDGNCREFLDSSLPGDKAGKTALTLALENDRLDFAQWMFQRGARSYSKEVSSVNSRVFLYIERDEFLSEGTLAKWPSGMSQWLPRDSSVAVPYEPLVHAVQNGSSKKLLRLIRALDPNRDAHQALVDNAYDAACKVSLPELEQVILSNSPWNLRRSVKVFRERYSVFRQIAEGDSAFQEKWILHLPQFLGMLMDSPDPDQIAIAFELYWKCFEGLNKGRIDQEIDFIQSYDLLLQKNRRSKETIDGSTLLRTSTASQLRLLDHLFEEAMSNAILDPMVLELLLIEGIPLTDNLVRKIASKEDLKPLTVLLRNSSVRKKHAIVFQNCFEESSTNGNNELVEVFQAFGLRHAK